MARQKDLITITDAAAERVGQLIAQRMKQQDKEAYGIRVGVKTGGCSGLSYTFEYADDAQKFEEIVEYKNIRVLIDPKAVMYLVGTKLDYVTEDMKSGFVFVNPNEKGQCGCGKSFHV